MSKTYKLVIEPCDGAEPPSAWGDENLFLVAYIRRHLEVGPPKKFSADPDTLREEGFLIFPVRGYVHSGVALALGGSAEASGYPFNDLFDSGWAGFVAVNMEEIENGSPGWREEYHPGRTSEQIAYTMAEGLIHTWNQYLSGDIWSYKVLEIETCSLGHEHYDIVESCGGFYGRDQAEAEGAAALEHCENKAKEKASGNTLGDPMYHEVLTEVLSDLGVK